MRSFSLWLVDDERAVEGRGLWFAGHGQGSATGDRRPVAGDL
jgi:hypothetical protein